MTENILYDHVFRFLHLCSCYFLYTIAPSRPTPIPPIWIPWKTSYMTKKLTLDHSLILSSRIGRLVRVVFAALTNYPQTSMNWYIHAGIFHLEALICKGNLPGSKFIPLCFRVSSLYSNVTDKILTLASVQFSCSVVSDSLRPHEPQHARPPCSPAPRVHWDSRPSSQWCHPAISSSVVPFSSCPQSLQASGSFPMSQLFAWGGQSTGVSALASFLPKKYQGWCPSEWTGWISLQAKGLSRVFSNTTVQKHQFFGAQPSSQSNSHIHTWPLEKP